MRDPVCGVTVGPDALTADGYDGIGFCSEHCRRSFLADPDRYAPALSGDDPVLALDRNSCTPGQRRYGVTYRSRMYLFASPETRQAFTADPDRYAARIALAERMPPATGGTRRY